MKRFKSPGWGYSAPHKKGYHGGHYVICDVCGRKIKANDAVFINDRYNLLNQMLVCPNDADKSNPQLFLRIRSRERQISDPRMVRSEGSNKFHYIDSPSEIESGSTSDPSGDAPDAPIQLEASAPSSTSIVLTWRFTGNPGSNPISGYKIERESPVGGGFSTIVANTGFPSLYYEDTGLSSSTQYNYKVSAINSQGTGNASNEAAATTA